MIKLSNSGYQKMFSLFMATTTLATGSSGAITISESPEPTILESIVTKVTKVVDSVEENKLDREMEECAAKIDAFYGQYQLPMTGLGTIFAEAAVEEGASCEIATLAATKAYLESTGGKYTPGSGDNESYNAFGWGCSTTAKCKSFDSFEEGIRVVIHNLAGNNPKTAKFYKDKTIVQIVNTYNPPSVAPQYLGNVLKTMKRIQNISVDETIELAQK